MGGQNHDYFSIAFLSMHSSENATKAPSTITGGVDLIHLDRVNPIYMDAS